MSETRTFDEDFAEICASESPLKVRLTALTAIISKHAPEFEKAYQVLVSQLSLSGAGSTAPKAGDRMPPFILPDHNSRLVKLDSLLGAGPLIVSFNRGHWCEYCELELRAFAAAHAEFVRHGARVVSIMPVRIMYVRNVFEKYNESIHVLCDIDNSYALELGLTIWLGDRVKELLTGSGVILEQIQGNGSWFVPIPATFVLNSTGDVVARFVDPDFRIRMDVDDIIAAIQSI